jgi:hypothetical protein
MKAKIVFAAVLLALATHGSSCIREGFLIPVNLTINQCYAINSGPVGSFDQSATILLSPLIDESFRGNIKGARFYDIKVSTTGSYSGTVVGQVYVNGVLLLLFGGGANNTTAVPWSTFSTPQSLLGSSQYVKAQSAGVTALVSALNRLVNDDYASVTLRVAGTTSGAAVPSGLSVCFQVLAQADAELNGGDDNGGPGD